MAEQKITEKEIAGELKDGAYVLVTQQEPTADGSETESLRRVPLSAFLEKCGGNGMGIINIKISEV